MIHENRINLIHFFLNIILGIDCQLPSKQIESNVKTLISNAISKAVKRKHTIPNYKIRYKPFFHRLDDDFTLQDIPFKGTIELTIIEVTRLRVPSKSDKLKSIYCTTTTSAIPLTVIKHFSDSEVIIEMDIEIIKAKNQQIGLIFKQDKEIITIDGIIPNTPASKVDLQLNDTLLRIEGRSVNSLNQVAKTIKNLNKPVLLLKILRKVNGVIKFENTDCEAEFKMTHQKEAKEDCEVVESNSVSNSPKRTGMGLLKSMKSKLIRTTSELKVQEAITVNQNNQKVDEDASKELTCYTFSRHCTRHFEMNDFISFEDTSKICFHEGITYINVNVIGVRENESELLLGYVNVPVNPILAESQKYTLKQMKHFYLLPPELPNL